MALQSLFKDLYSKDASEFLKSKTAMANKRNKLKTELRKTTNDFSKSLSKDFIIRRGKSSNSN